MGKLVIIIGNYTIDKLRKGETIELQDATLVPDSELMTVSKKLPIKNKSLNKSLKEIWGSIVPDLIEKYFPKGECKERGQAIVLVALIYCEVLPSIQSHYKSRRLSKEKILDTILKLKFPRPNGWSMLVRQDCNKIAHAVFKAQEDKVGI